MITSARMPSMSVQLSVLLATRNRAPSLGRTLERLLSQNLHGLNWELVVVDNGSTDETAAVLRSFADRLPLKAVLEREPGKSRALNAGLAVATGELVVLTDDDVQPANYWLSELWSASLRHPGASIFGGPISPILPADCPPWLRNHRFAGALFTTFVPSLTEAPLAAHVVPLGPNVAIRRRLLPDVWFDPTMGPQPQSGYAIGADVDFVLRLCALGHVPMFVPKAIVRHVVRDEQLLPKWLLLRSYSWGRGVARLYQDRYAPRIAGAPVYAWLWLSRSWWRGLGGDPDDRLGRAMSYQFARGLLREERATRLEASGSNSTIDPRTCFALREFYAGWRTTAPS